jgi:hypothetical protein
VYFLVIWYIFGHLEHFFLILVCHAKKNLATLSETCSVLDSLIKSRCPYKRDREEAFFLKQGAKREKEEEEVEVEKKLSKTFYFSSRF